MTLKDLAHWHPLVKPYLASLSRPEWHWFAVTAAILLAGTLLARFSLAQCMLSYSTAPVQRWNPVRWITSGALHDGALHLGGNLLLLYSMIPLLKITLPISSWAAFSFLFQILICSFRSLFRLSDSQPFSIGASGWLLAWLAFLTIRCPSPINVNILFLYSLPGQEAVFYGFLSSLLFAVGVPQSRIDHECHAWGLLIGAAIGLSGVSL